MIITIINDCRDKNAEIRQLSRVASLFRKPVCFVGVQNDLEASGNIIDTLDALEERRGIILVNVAPRNGEAKKWENGTPFGYFFYKNTLVVSSIDGYILSLVKKLGITELINVLDIPSVIEIAVKNNLITDEVGNHIIKTQFRSYDFLPRVAKWIYDGFKIPNQLVDVNKITNTSNNFVWFVDNFGNCKTSILEEEIKVDKLGIVTTNMGKFKYYPRLKDVPNGESAMITGSSGIGTNRFLEIVIQGTSAADKFNLGVGTKINLAFID